MELKRLSRRDLIKYGGLAILGSAAAGSVLGCSETNFSNAVGSGTDTGDGTTGGACGVIPSETAGPYPAHDDSAINVLRINGINRSDIRSSLNSGGYSGTATATGVPLLIQLNLLDVNSACAPLAGYVIYLWHCDINGKYSMYSSGVTQETYLRGVQQTDTNGQVAFQTIFPGCYDGRMTHVHFEIYPSLAEAVDDSYIVRTSQFTFPLATSSSVYNNVSGYSASKTNFAKISFATDNVFSDGTAYQMASMSGSYSSGLVATLDVGIKA
ncbi:intradiol ring-cleavage dioxygenase [Bdellovibrio bacteriovorus]|uniref:dioxygenase family protein n=1 Tax=Bdellovibrio bacteriovorus TaxID=959 RepID=UPI0021D3E4FD|nr:intradiol ring-cleavage dioxygenase [Bdellovibrio bacteriovorus]UXR64537.1 intradiol ring-cleavage dioxygenase [Bdellovibrio bacteriovorus]